MLVLILSIGMSLVETIGVASVMPFLAILGDPAMINENKYLNLFYSFSTQIGFGEIHKFMTFVGLLCFILILFLLHAIEYLLYLRLIDSRRCEDTL